MPDLRRPPGGWLVLATVLAVIVAPVGYGITLLVTAPALAGMWASRLSRAEGAYRLVAMVAGAVACIALVWLIGRVDERPLEGLVAGGFVAAAVSVLLVIRFVPPDV